MEWREGSTSNAATTLTARSAATLIRIDPRRRRVRDTIRTGRGPFAVDVHRGRNVWFTLAGEDAIQRVRLR